MKGGVTRGGVKANFPTWENWEKPPTTIVAEVEKEKLTLEVTRNIETTRETKDCESRRGGEKDT